MAECIFCGTSHGRACPLVKALEFGEGGIETPLGPVTRVEFMTPNDFRFAQQPQAQPAADEGGGDYPRLQPSR